jgi:hypothetical protein
MSTPGQSNAAPTSSNARTVMSVAENGFLLGKSDELTKAQGAGGG